MWRNNFQKLFNTLFTRSDFLFLIEGRTYEINYSLLNHGLRVINNERNNLVQTIQRSFCYYIH
jgi:hypothetical protein